MSKQVAVITTSRADFSALTPLIKRLQDDSNINLKLLAAHSHPAINLTDNKLIGSDNFKIHRHIELNKPSDDETGACAAIAQGLSDISKYLQEDPPDLILVLGDRFELWSICMAAVIHKIPIGHIYGGEITQGAIDNSIRHSVSKMATFHFVSVDEHAKRVSQMGENPDSIYTVGALSLDAIEQTKRLSITELNEKTSVDFNNDISLMTYHPVTLDNHQSAKDQVREILNALLKTAYKTLITMPNEDPARESIIQEIKTYCNEHPERFHYIESLGKTGYYSALEHCKLVIGNSSSGLIETMAFKKPVINIGDRQKGRLTPPNVLCCQCEETAILSAIKDATTDKFYHSFSSKDDPLGKTGAAEHIVAIIKDLDLSNKSQLLKKDFFDLPQD